MTKLYRCEVQLKIEDAVHLEIKMNHINDMVIVIKPNKQNH